MGLGMSSLSSVALIGRRDYSMIRMISVFVVVSRRVLAIFGKNDALRTIRVAGNIRV